MTETSKPTAVEIATIDFESRSLCEISRGSFVYSTHRSTQVYCLAYKIGSRPTKLWHRGHPKVGIKQSPDPVDLIEHIQKGYLVEAHNAGFEFNMWNNNFRAEFPQFPILGLEQLRCSAAKAAQFALPRSLEGACDAMRLPVRKNMDGKKVMLRVSKIPPKWNKEKQIQKWEAELELGLITADDLPWNEDPHDLQSTWSYCVDDVEAEHCLSTHLREMRPRELEMWQMDMRMNLRGIHCDDQGARIAIDMAEAEALRINDRIGELTGGSVPKGSSRVKLKAWANEQGFPIQNTQADHIKEVMAACKERFSATPEGRLVLEVMGLCMDVNQTSTTKYVQMLEMVGWDGRLRDLMLYYGAARTGRWSGKGVQPHNFIRGFSEGKWDGMDWVWTQIMRNDSELLRLWFGSVMKVLAKATRGALTASPGRDLMVADYAAIEARVLPWLADDQALLDIFRAGQDIYLKMAGDIYETDPAQAEFMTYIRRLRADPTNKPLLKEIKEKFPVLRHMGKKAILGLGFQMGAEKFDDECANEDPPINLPRPFFQKVVKTYREKTAVRVCSFWTEIEEKAVWAIKNKGKRVDARMVAYKFVGDFLHCQLPSGRLLAYHYPTVSTSRTFMWAAENKQGKEATIRVRVKPGEDVKAAYGRAKITARLSEKRILNPSEYEVQDKDAIFFSGVDQKTKKYVRMTTYGGSLTENVTQATARDFMGEAMLRCDKTEEYDMLLSVHDELIAEVDEDKGNVKEFEAMMAAPPDWMPADNPCPIAAEGWRGKRYRK